MLYALISHKFGCKRCLGILDEELLVRELVTSYEKGTVEALSLDVTSISEANNLLDDMGIFKSCEDKIVTREDVLYKLSVCYNTETGKLEQLGELSTVYLTSLFDELVSDTVRYRNKIFTFTAKGINTNDTMRLLTSVRYLFNMNLTEFQIDMALREVIPSIFKGYTYYRR